MEEGRRERGRGFVAGRHATWRAYRRRVPLRSIGLAVGGDFSASREAGSLVLWTSVVSVGIVVVVIAVTLTCICHDQQSQVLAVHRTGWSLRDSSRGHTSELYFNLRLVY